MMFLSKEATNKDQSFKMKIMLSHDKMFQQILKKFGKKPCFFGDRKADFTIKKTDFPENTLVYCSQGTISTLKARDYAI